MSWLSKIFSKKEENEEEKRNGGHVSSEASSIASPFEGLDGIRFGRYSDNNKSYKKTKCWYESEDLFKEKRYNEALEALFEYMKDDKEDNVSFHKNGDSSFTFDIAQGSKMVHGECDGQRLIARVPLAVMDTPNTAVMRRLLELNYNLYYARTAMDAYNLLYMLFDTDIASATPNKLYYGLRELATKADRQDDLLLADFTSLKPAGTEHIKPVSEHELDVKYQYLRKWTEDTLRRVDELNQDSFSGAIAYLLLTLIYRIDFLITPQAKFLTELEKTSGLYWDKKEETALVERNQMMKEAVKKFLNISKQEFAASIYRVKDSFAISTPPKLEKVKEHIVNANKDSYWYVDNKYTDIGITLNEYGMLYNQFIYSMPRVMTDLTTIYMAVLHPDYFAELGMKTPLHHKETKHFEKQLIEKAVDEALDQFKDKYASMKWKHDRTEYDSLFDFGISFSEQMANLNLETKR